MSTMDYGLADQPPAPEAAPAVDWRLVGRRAIRIVALYAVIAAVGLLTLAVHDAITGATVISNIHA